MKKQRKVKASVSIKVKPPIKLGKVLKTPIEKREEKFPAMGVRDNEIWQTAEALQTK